MAVNGLVESLVKSLRDDLVLGLVGSGFDPVSLFANGEQGAWYDPSDLTTLYQDAAGTTPVTADGDPVGYIQDLSGNGNHATQSVAASRPVYRTDGALHWLEFDGVDDYMDAAINIPQPVTENISALFSGNIKYALSTTDGTGANRLDLLVVDDISPDYRIFAGSPVVANGSYVAGEKAAITAIFNGASSLIRKNASDIGFGNAGANSLDGLRIGAAYNIGSFLPGNVYGLIVRGVASSERENSNAEQYLAQKSGVTL